MTDELNKVVDIGPHLTRDWRGYFPLSDLPQRNSVARHAFGSGWPDLDEIFKFYAGQFVLITGIPGHGKSTFILNVLAKMARERGVGSFLYVPENEAHLREKMRMIWDGDDESFDHFASSQCFVQSAMPEHYLDEAQTLDWVLDRASYAVQKEKVEIVLIDPWNELDRAKPKNMLLTDYVGECLRLLKQFCRALNAIVILVAHPTKEIKETGNKITSLSQVESSMNWFNKCDNGLIIAREGNSAKVISAKVREIGAGRVGSCNFYVDPDTGKFTPMHGSASLVS